MKSTNQQVWRRSRPNGIPQAENSAIRKADIPHPADGQVLMRNRFLSADPAMRGWITDSSNYWPQIVIGETLRAFAAGEVVESKHPSYRPGDRLMGIFGWQGYAVAEDKHIMVRIPDDDLPLSLYLGVLGLNALAAYLLLPQERLPN